MEYTFTLYRKAKRGAADEYECTHVDDLIISLPQVITRVYNNVPVRSITLTLGNPLPADDLDSSVVSVLSAMENLSVEAGEESKVPLQETLPPPAPVSVVRVDPNQEDILKRLENLEKTVLSSNMSSASFTMSNPSTPSTTQTDKQVLLESASIDESLKICEKCVVCLEVAEVYKHCTTCKEGLVCMTCSEAFRRVKFPKICPNCRSDMPHLYVPRPRGRPPKTPKTPNQ